MSFIPAKFAREPLSLKDVKYRKATKFLQFFLYTGLVVLYHKLCDKIFQNSLMLHVSISIMADHIMCSWVDSRVVDHICLWSHLLITFAIYDLFMVRMRFMVYDMHNLIHLPDDAKKFGSLDLIASFPFGIMTHVKRIVGKAESSLQQIVHRYM